MSIQPFSSDSGFSTTGNITANNIGNVAAINLNGNTSTVLSGNGTWVVQGGGGSANTGNIYFTQSTILSNQSNAFVNLNDDVNGKLSLGTTSGANVQVAVNDIANASGAIWVYDATGNLTLPGNTSAINYANGTSILSGAGGSGNIGNLTATGNVIYANSTGIPSGFVNFDTGTGMLLGTNSDTPVNLTSNIFGTASTWTFNTNGNLTLPGNASAINYANGTNILSGIGGVSNYIENGNSSVSILTSNGNVGVGVAGNGIATFSGNGIAVTGQITGTYSPATATGAGIVAQGANTQGGTGYFDFLKVTNQSGGANNSSKFLRVDAEGGIQVINSAYSATILALTDSGNLTVVGSGSNVTRRAFGLVAADVNVTLDDLSANVSSATSQLAISTSGSWQGTGYTETFTSGTPSVQTWVNLPLSSGFSTASGAMNSQGQGCRCVITDQTPSAKMYEINVIRSGTTGALWNISIERLV